ncbi:response regulator [Deinococcus koreensis]|uniref:Response regulator n=1 Tax=Deinococcus koreensis TaxID=2054903 RepID=A0A2K3UTX4_9DEIO|nr:response regulator [Deinococcus koreensis]PNY79992.1 response regulator [Deinococcus koreensis]
MTPPTATPGLRLLVVDDELQILELLDLTLSMQGYLVQTASSGPQALDVAAQSPIDVIVMDVLMTPWDGFETVRQLQRQAAGGLPPVVFLSGLNRPDTLPDLGPALRVDYLAKPFRPSQLVAAIEQLWALTRGDSA